MMYQLIRITPDGIEKHHSPMKRLRNAAVNAGFVLHDNAGVSRTEAQRFSAELARLPLGTDLAHESGYVFRIVAVAA